MFTKESAKKLYDEIASKNERRLPQRGDIYRHFKGHLITVIGIAMHTESEEPLVIYHCHNGLITARPLDMFLQPVDKEKYPNVEQKYRLERVSILEEITSEPFISILKEMQAQEYDTDPEEVKAAAIDRYLR